MAAPQEIELPLYDAFIKLQQLEKGQDNRGVDTLSYLALINTMRRGYLLNNPEELIFFCKKLWLKPFHLNNPVINEKVIEDIITASLAAYGIVETSQPPVTGQAEKQPPDMPALTGQKTTLPEPDVPTTENPLREQVVSKPVAVPLVVSIEETTAATSLEEKDYSNYFNDKQFQFNYQYLPVSRRFIEQTIRSLRYRVKGAGRPVADMEATVKDMVSRGYFQQLVMREQDDFITMWTLLFDRGGSMLAFHDLQDALAAAACSGTMKNEGDIFYFRNVAEDHLYLNPQRTRSAAFEQVAAGPRRNILIVSDAGAARGGYNDSRIDDTFLMLYQLRKHRVAWLNPMPEKRWSGTSATAIATMVNMFEPGDNDYSDNLGNIVQLFKSKLITRVGV